MQKTTFSVPNISCGHCVSAIQSELREMDGVVEVHGDPATKEITVEWDPPASESDIKATLAEINYPAAE
jgi:copper chaperone CopZ